MKQDRSQINNGSEELAQTIEYIAEREETLSKYSNKLRLNVQRIFNIFGDPLKCQECGSSKDCGSKHGIYYDLRDNQGYDSLPEFHKNGDKSELIESTEGIGQFGNPGKKTMFFLKNTHPHKFIPKIRVSIAVQGDVFFNDGYEWALDLDNKGLSFVKYIDIRDEIISAERAPREVLKGLISSNQLIDFLKYVADDRKTKSNEYQEVADIAEKMAQAIL